MEPGIFDNMISMAIQSSILRTLSSGLDVIKVNQQIHGRSLTFEDGLKRILTSPSIFFQGNGTALCRYFPYYYIRLWCQRYFYRLFENKYPRLRNMISDIIAITITHPLDTIKNRFTIFDLNYGSTSISNGIYRILKYEGFFALWSGLIPAIFASVPYSLADVLSNAICSYRVGWLGSFYPAIALGISSCICQTVSIPFDMVKKRMQINTAASQVDIIRNIYSTEGIYGFFNGLLANHIKAMVLPILTYYLKPIYKSESFKENKTLILSLILLLNSMT